MDECEADNLDKAFDVRRNSRLACQARLQAEQTYVVRISSASRQTFFDEHPEVSGRPIGPAQIGYRGRER